MIDTFLCRCYSPFLSMQQFGPVFRFDCNSLHSIRATRCAKIRPYTGERVADIIPIDERLADAREKKVSLDRKQKIRAVQKIFQCTRCAFKCEKCGTQIDPQATAGSKEPPCRQALFRLCEDCRAEYQDYLRWQQGRTDSKTYWRNDAWRELWRNWIAYQKSIERYMESREFLQLLHELKSNEYEE